MKKKTGIHLLLDLQSASQAYTEAKKTHDRYLPTGKHYESLPIASEKLREAAIALGLQQAVILLKREME